MNSIQILIAESHGFSANAIGILQKVGLVKMADLDRRALLSVVEEFAVLWVRLRNQIDDEVMDAARKLCLIATPTTGLNHIDLLAAERRGISVLSLRGETEFLREIRATAELTIGLTIALLRKIPAAFRHAISEIWDRDLFKGNEINGKTVGIIGYGRLGKIVASYFAALGADVLVTDPNVQGEDVDQGEQLVSMSHLLRTADIVSLHVSLTDATKNMFDRTCFQVMKHGSYFINTARGELVEESALLNALKCGHLAGAAVDVICGELDKDLNKNALISYARTNDNLIITPHIGGCTRESMAKTEDFLARKVVEFAIRNQWIKA